MKNIKSIADRLVDRASEIIIGKPDQLRLATAAIFSGGHILFDDLPGTGKTTLVKVLSRILGCTFARVQFTPDLLPTDIIGMNVFNQKTGEFELKQGPIITHVFLADEINRAIPRTQSALLEAMEELQVTIDSKTYPLPTPFLVMATQNAVEMESTFHLPIAQMDRFLMRLSLGYLSHDDEITMLRTVGDELPLESVDSLLSPVEISEIQKQIRNVHVSESVLGYIVDLADMSRRSDYLRLPVGPRGSRALYRAGKAWAAMNGRGFVIPDDVKELAPHVLSHRVLLSNEARLNKKTERDVIWEILTAVPAPMSKEEILHG